MKVFISWSGTRSKKIAEIFRKWIPGVIQAVKPYFTPDDIAKGARWANEIAKELAESKIGVFILTAENLTAPWIIFEAGAISKQLDSARVCPLLFGVSPADVKGPLEQFQCSAFSKEEVRKLLRSINAGLGETALDSAVLENVFEMWWPKLESDVKIVVESKPKDGEEPKRDQMDILEELVLLARRTYSGVARAGSSFSNISPGAVEDLVFRYTALVDFILATSPAHTCIGLLRELGRPIRHMLERVRRIDGDRFSAIRPRFEEAYERLATVDAHLSIADIADLDFETSESSDTLKDSKV